MMKLAKVEYCNWCLFSKNGLFLLYVVDNKIFLMEIENLRINKIYVTSYKIDYIEFSSDNVHFLVLIKDKGCVLVYSFYDDDVIYKIEDHFQKYTHSFFINKYSYICVLKYEQKCISIYDTNKEEMCLLNIKNAKLKKKKYCLNEDETIFACITENNKKNKICLISFPNCAFINTIQCINYEPNCVFFTKTNNIITHSKKSKSIHMYKIDGELLYVYSYLSQLPCVNVLSENSHRNVLLLGMENDEVKVLSSENLKEIKILLLEETITMDEKLKIYKENISKKNMPNFILSSANYDKEGEDTFSFYTNISEGVHGKYKLKSEITKMNDSIKNIKTDMTTKIGITFLCVSICGNYIAIVNESYNNVVRVYYAENFSCIVVLQQQKKITNIRWDSILYKPRLLITTNTPYLFVWMPNESTVIQMPNGFICKDAQMSFHGTALLAKSQTKLALFQNKRKSP
ncbi:WD repeat-containing protein WRAP73, putative [Plasmodium chabaudi chabaudi]|uniref:WD repeat-containing protein WRAP73, putative n=1 Tax=Plasmodium chabaudi chabaudi TaxID=31271 RepID=A0A1D3RUY3_PLACU|nr:WD repeat-containing protein WRAP73, putative [Plasmodium chabaudi chabaudi]